MLTVGAATGWAALGRSRLLIAAGSAALLLACAEEPRPRNFADFTEDRIAREGTLARCNAAREATLNDLECANARRAAAAIALREERDRREALERESERKLAAMRDQMARRDMAAREAEAAALAAREEAYERMWKEGDTPPDAALVPGSAPFDAGATAAAPTSAGDAGVPDAGTGAAAGAMAAAQHDRGLEPLSVRRSGDQLGTVEVPMAVKPLPDAEPAGAGPALEEIVIPRPFRRDAE